MRTDYHNHLELGTLELDYLMKFIDEAKVKKLTILGFLNTHIIFIRQKIF